MTQVLHSFAAIILGIGGIAAYFYFSNRLLDYFLRDPQDISRTRQREQIRPWLFLAPALLMLFLYLLFPMLQTFVLSFMSANGRKIVWLDNYVRAFRDPQFEQSVGNNILWLVFVPSSSIIFGLLIARLADGVRWGGIAKSLIFMPMAISFVGASVIWKFIYNINPRIGLLNAIVVTSGGTPVDVLQIPFWNNFFLFIILIWIEAGFAMVLLSAALNSIPEELTEAARIDGANEIQLFYYVQLPQIMSVIYVLWTAISIEVLKVFDIVATMTNGNWNTQVVANYMYDQRFRAFNTGYASFLALVIMLAVIPIMVSNVRRFRREARF